MTQYLFVTGIDTDIGKSVATGWLAKRDLKAGLKVSTFKPVQTGTTGLSPDIALHRRIMGVPLSDEDMLGLSSPIRYAKPASPHFAAELEGQTIEMTVAEDALRAYGQAFDRVWVEGAGGPLVPLTRETMTIDWVKKMRWPAVLVTSPRLGSISHTLAALEAIEARGVPLAGLVMNAYFEGEDEAVARDTADYLKAVFATRHKDAFILDLPKLVL